MRTIGNKKSFLINIVCGAVAFLLAAALLVGDILAFGAYKEELTEKLRGKNILEPYKSSNYFPAKAVDYEEALEMMEEVSRNIEAEGAVLMKNEHNALPLSRGARVSLFSQSSVDMIYGTAAGPSAADAAKRITLKEALETEGFVVNSALWEFYEGKTSYRRKLGGMAGGWSYWDAFPFLINEVPYDQYTQAVKNSYADYGDAAIVVIARGACENSDLPRNMSVNTSGANTGSYLELDATEREMLRNVCENFEKVVVLLNTSNAMECGFLDEYDIDACLWMGVPGDFGMTSVAKIFSGEVNPSGKLADTYAYDVFSSPAMQNMGNFEYRTGTNDARHRYVTYAEGIYVGYKYYETRYEDAVLNRGNAGAYDYNATVQFPFGYGLSYTTFAWSDFTAQMRGDKIDVSVTVRNTGDTAGKDVVQAYYQSPYTEYDKRNGVEKAAVSLAGYVKTDLLAPGSVQKVSVTFDVEDMKSYDTNGKKTYYLEGSDSYYVTAAKDAHAAVNNVLKAKGAPVAGDAAFAAKLAVQEKVYDTDTTSGNAVGNLFDDADGSAYHNEDIEYLSRSDWSAADNSGLRFGALRELSGMSSLDNDGEIYYTQLPYELQRILESEGTDASGAPDEDFETPTAGQNGVKRLIEMKGRDFTDSDWQKLLDQVTVPEMERMIRYGGYKIDFVQSVGKPLTTDKDGPQSWAINIFDGATEVKTGRMPFPVVLAATYNAALAEDAGDIMGELAYWVADMNTREPNLTGWYAPAVNIHRTPFGGRNFEYYSEDSALTAQTGAQVVKGASERGLICYVKHFALNEQDRNRMTTNVVWAQEQAIREIYAKPFEAAVKQGNALGIMTAYNRVGAVWAGGNYNLITGLLRNEWGFNGIVVTDFMDGNWMNTDQMLAAGGDTALNTADTHDYASVTLDTKGSRARTYMRRATQHIMYATANSRGMNGIKGAMHVLPGKSRFNAVMTGINAGAGAAIAVCLALLLCNIFVFSRKEKIKGNNGIEEDSQTERSETENEAEK